MQEKEIYGKATVGYGTDKQREINVVNFFQGTFIDHRLISILELEDGSYILSVENPESTGRTNAQKMWLSKESFSAMLIVGTLYLTTKGENFENIAKEAVGKEQLDIVCSNNLKIKK